MYHPLSNAIARIETVAEIKGNKINSLSEASVAKLVCTNSQLATNFPIFPALRFPAIPRHPCVANHREHIHFPERFSKNAMVLSALVSKVTTSRRMLVLGC